MTCGKLIYCLRDVHRYWSTPRLSSRELRQLKQLNLVQRTVTGSVAIRLTEEGVRVKNWK
jgi:hypothetical protein